MKDKKQFVKGIIAGFVIALILAEGAMLGRNFLESREDSAKEES